MNPWLRAVPVIIGLAVFVIFYPVRGVGGCPSGGGCTSRSYTFWNLPLPGGDFTILPAVAFGLAAAGLTYFCLLLLGRRRTR